MGDSVDVGRCLRVASGQTTTQGELDESFV